MDQVGAAGVGAERMSLPASHGNAAGEPLVSVLTPVYNGERYLRQCIESVLAQAYTNWEHIIVNNRSTDRSAEIAAGYAHRESRIRIHHNDAFVGVIRNHNIAFGLLSPQSKYCKIVHADDWLFPDCLAQMVRVAEAHPSVGIVGAYALNGTRVECGGLSYPSTVVPGRALCRLTLLEEVYPFLSPSCLLLRSDLIRQAHGAFYDERHIFADAEACFEVLQRSDFGFVHQVLTFVRTHDESVSASYADRLNTYAPAWLHMLARYGPRCLSEDEYRRLWRQKLEEYYRFLGRRIFRSWRDRQFWAYHAEALGSLWCRLRWTRVLRASALEALDALGHPLRAVGRAISVTREGARERRAMGNIQNPLVRATEPRAAPSLDGDRAGSGRDVAAADPDVPAPRGRP